MKTMNRFGMATALVLAGLMVAQADEMTAAGKTHAEIDPAHSIVGFGVKHMVINKVHGQFKDFTGNLELDGTKLASAEATIKATSIDTGTAKRDEHLRTPDFLDVAKYPDITFKSTAVRGNVIVGDLTMRGVTKSVELTYTLSGPVEDPYKNTRYGLELSGKINRNDFGVSYNKALEGGGLVVGNDVDLSIDAEFIKK